MNDLPGRGDVNPYGIPVPNPYEREGPDECEGNHPAGECPWCDQANFDAHVATKIAMEYDRRGREDERCPTCGTTERGDRFAMLDRGRAFDAGISGCPDPFHEGESGR
jgi:hypothetical protein